MWSGICKLFAWLFGGAKPRAGVPARLPKLSEVEFARRIAKAIGGVTEHRLNDDCRVDILTGKNAIEVDWSHKWAEGIGQALYYGAITHRKPTVLLLVDLEKDSRFINRCHTVCTLYSIDLWIYNWPAGRLLLQNGEIVEVK